MKAFTIFLAAFTFVATLLPVLQSNAWWIRVFDFPRVQIIVLGLTAIVLSIIFLNLKSWQAIFPVIAVIAIIVQAVQVFPFTRLAKVQVVKAQGTAGISIMVCNVRMDNTEHQRVLDTIHRASPDIVLLLEPDKKWMAALNDLEKEYPFLLKEPLDNTYGIALYSRLKLHDARIRHLIEEEVPSVFALIEVEGNMTAFYGLHPKPPKPNDDTDERDAELIIVAKEVKEKGIPAIVAGDLNDVAWSHTTRLFQRISRSLDPRRGRGMFSTYNANVPLMRFPLDHIFHTEHFTLHNISKMGDVGSDHFPMLISLSYEPEAAAKQEPPRRQSDDRREAREKLEEGA